MLCASSCHHDLKLRFCMPPRWPPPFFLTAVNVCMSFPRHRFGAAGLLGLSVCNRRSGLSALTLPFVVFSRLLGAGICPSAVLILTLAESCPAYSPRRLRAFSQCLRGSASVSSLFADLHSARVANVAEADACVWSLWPTQLALVGKRRSESSK